MNLKINRSILLDEISKANKIIDPKTINPDLLGILFNVEAEKIIILSTNGSMNWKSVINQKRDPHLEIKRIGKILIKGKYLIDILRKMEDDVIELNMVETSELIIKGQTAKFKLQILDETNFPLVGFRENGNVIKINPKELKRAISQVIISIDEYNKKILLTGMNLKGSKDQNTLEIYTTDSFRISKSTIKLAERLENDLDITIPLKTLTELLRLTDSTSELKMILVEGYLTFVFDGKSLLQTILIEGKFPNVERAFPTNYPTKITLTKAKIMKAINRANIGNDENIAQTVSLEIGADNIKITSQSIDIGNYHEDFKDFNFTGEQQSISFNIKFLLEALRTFEGNEIELNLIGPTKPLEIKEVNNDSLRQLILPLSVN